MGFGVPGIKRPPDDFSSEIYTYTAYNPFFPAENICWKYAYIWSFCCGIYTPWTYVLVILISTLILFNPKIANNLRIMTRRLASVKQLPGFGIHKNAGFLWRLLRKKTRNKLHDYDFKNQDIFSPLICFKGGWTCACPNCLSKLWNHVLKFGSGGANAHYRPNARIPTLNLLDIDAEWHDPYEVSQDPVWFFPQKSKSDKWHMIQCYSIWSGKRIPDVYPNIMKRFVLLKPMLVKFRSSKLNIKNIGPLRWSNLSKIMKINEKTFNWKKPSLKLFSPACCRFLLPCLLLLDLHHLNQGG